MKMKKTSLNTTKVTDRKIKRLYLVAATVVAAAFVMAMPAFADDPLTTINNLSDFVFSAIKAIGAILLGFGIVQIGLALKGHDASQRAQGFMTFFGVVVTRKFEIFGRYRPIRSGLPWGIYPAGSLGG